jgi:polysaccharide deacetylase 2 family uncharacterized protein YibQ
MRSRPIPRLRFAAIILILACATVVAFLVACPPVPVQPAPAPHAAGAPRPVEPPSPPVIAAAAVPERPQPEKEGLVAFVLDDAGYNLEELQSFLDLPGTFTVAVLPNLPHSREAARMVLAAGKDLILHCPMEPTGGENPGPGALLVGLDQQEIEARLARAFASVPGALGMNNHMGSRATADETLMTTVLGYLKKESLFYIDSRTTPDTVGPRVAQALGVPFAQRDVFIDDDTAPDLVHAAWARGVEEAKNRGSSILIGHVQNRAVLDILKTGEKELSGRQVRLARLSDVISWRERNPVE